LQVKEGERFIMRIWDARNRNLKEANNAGRYSKVGAA